MPHLGFITWSFHNMRQSQPCHSPMVAVTSGGVHVCIYFTHTQNHQHEMWCKSLVRLKLGIDENSTPMSMRCWAALHQSRIHCPFHSSKNKHISSLGSSSLRKTNTFIDISTLVHQILHEDIVLKEPASESIHVTTVSKPPRSKKYALNATVRHFRINNIYLIRKLIL